MLGEAMFKLLAVVVAGSLGAAAITDEEYTSFPKLYHLDDFERCLLRKDGLYCLGTFHLKPLHDPHPNYELMKEYSSDPHNFNRTLIHRGYCVNLRCPSLHDRNVSQRFERCASLQARHYSLRASLTELYYCRSHTQDTVLKDYRNSVETPHRVFLYVVGFILFLNVIGTTYDVMTRSNKKKSKLLSCWSLVSNWSQLVCPYPDGDPRLATLLPIEGFRLIMILLVVFVHTGCFHEMLFLQNPKFVEEMSHHPVMMPLQNSMPFIQMFTLLSSFLLAHSLLSMKQPSFWILPKLVLKRVIRIAPIYLLIISFAATWWPLVRDGPMWPMLVTAESEVCKRKYWANFFFLQNLVEPERHCQVQTWFLAVSMQLYIVGSILTLCLLRARRLALPLLGTAYITTCLLNAYRAYMNEWKPFMFITTPNNIRTMFLNVPSFSELYTSPLAGLPACLVGLFVAFLHHHLLDKGFRPEQHKWLIISCQMTKPLLLAWWVSGTLFRHFTSQAFMAQYVALERLVIDMLTAALLFGAYNGTSKKDIINSKNAVLVIKDKKIPKTPTTGYLQYIYSSRALYSLGRLSLSVFMVHWCINSVIVASQLTPITSSFMDMVSHWITTSVLSYLLAVPVTLMVEIPFQKLYSALTS